MTTIKLSSSSSTSTTNSLASSGLSPELVALVARREIPARGVSDIERILDHFGYDYTRRGTRMYEYTFSNDDEAYIRMLLARRNSRRNDDRRRHASSVGAASAIRRNEYYAARHARRRAESNENVEKLAWFNTSFLFANLRRRGMTCDVPRDQILELSKKPCYYCGDIRSGGIDRRDATGAYTVGNIVSCCRMCNYMKGGMHECHFLAYCVSAAAKQVPMTVTARATHTSYSKNQRGASDRGREFTLTEEDHRRIVTSACVRCGLPNCQGVDRIDSNTGYILSNVRPMCFVCNFVRGPLSDAMLDAQFNKIAANHHHNHGTTFTGRSLFTGIVWEFVDGVEARLIGRHQKAKEDDETDDDGDGNIE